MAPRNNCQTSHRLPNCPKKLLQRRTSAAVVKNKNNKRSTKNERRMSFFHFFTGLGLGLYISQKYDVTKAYNVLVKENKSLSEIGELAKKVEQQSRRASS